MPEKVFLGHLMVRTGFSAKEFGVLVSVEMITAMVCYVPAAH